MTSPADLIRSLLDPSSASGIRLGAPLDLSPLVLVPIFGDVPRSDYVP